MAKKVTTITLLILSIIIVSLYVISTTYSVIINVIDNDGTTEILNKITIRDLVTDENGMYNSTYYEVLDELDINDEEANILMNSVELNKALDTFVESIVDYRIHNKDKLSNNEIYKIISDAIYNDNNIDNDLKNKALIKAKEYISDISKYLYDIETVNQGESA